MSDIVLLNPPSSWFTEKKLIAPPLGLGYLASTLEERGYSVEILDMFSELMGRYELADYVEKKKPYIIGITSNLRTYNNAVLMAKTIKQIF